MGWRRPGLLGAGCADGGCQASTDTGPDPGAGSPRQTHSEGWVFIFNSWGNYPPGVITEGCGGVSRTGSLETGTRCFSAGSPSRPAPGNQRPPPQTGPAEGSVRWPPAPSMAPPAGAQRPLPAPGDGFPRYLSRRWKPARRSGPEKPFIAPKYQDTAWGGGENVGG